MSSHPPLEFVRSAKHWCWRTYQNEPWFTGCRTNTDNDEAHLELLYDPGFSGPVPHAVEKYDVKIVAVPWKEEVECPR